MAAKDIPGKVGEAELRGYLTRILEDEKLRGNLVSAYGTARSAYGRMSNGKPPTQALFEDRKLQNELKQAATALRDASSALREPAPHRRRRGGLGRSLLLLSIAGVLAMALSEGIRSKVLDLLFGSEEEFDYSATSAPAEPAPAGIIDRDCSRRTATGFLQAAADVRNPPPRS